jgi:hypothetical protein
MENILYTPRLDRWERASPPYTRRRKLTSLLRGFRSDRDVSSLSDYTSGLTWSLSRCWVSLVVFQTVSLHK